MFSVPGCAPEEGGEIGLVPRTTSVGIRITRLVVGRSSACSLKLLNATETEICLAGFRNSNYVESEYQREFH